MKEMGDRKYYKPSEIEKMGISRWEIMCDCRSQGQTFATKSKGGHWKIDFEKYMKYRERRTIGKIKRTSGGIMN